MNSIKGSNYIDDKEAFLCLDLSKDKSLLKPNYYSGLTLGYIPCDKVESEGDYQVEDQCISNSAEQL